MCFEAAATSCLLHTASTYCSSTTIILPHLAELSDGVSTPNRVERSEFCRRIDKALLQRQRHQLWDGMDFQLLHQARPMFVDGLCADAET